MGSLWTDDDPVAWRAVLERYPEVIAAQGVRRLAELDDWYRQELPDLIAGRTSASVTLAELVRATEWKMARGVWRQRNLLLVRGNEASAVEAVSRDALARIPDPIAPITLLATLRGVGPATASAVAAAAAPEVYPFFDELVAAQVPALGEVDFTTRYYVRYAEALRDRSRRLGEGWTPTLVERALWAHAGGKAGLAGTPR